jgi:anti-sigma B factor antagonist
MIVDITRQKETITIKTGSRLDANTAPELADQIATMQFEKLVVDMADTAYVSSAGLRALMIGKKTADAQGAALEIVHVQPAVEEIFEMSGFKKFLTIH